MRNRHYGLHLFLIAMSVLWLFPVLWAVYTSLRPYADTAARGYVSLPGSLTLDNYVRAFHDGEILGHFVSTVIVVVPSVVAILAIALAVGFIASRISWRFNVAMLVVFTAASLLPPHIVVTPLLRLFLNLPVPPPLSDNGVAYDQLFGLFLIHVAVQIGFCAFVLAAFIRSIPGEVIDAARLDGASLPRLLASVVAPLSKPALVALAALETAWIYNDFLWGLVLIQTPDRRPVTAAIASISGEFFTDYNVIAAGAILVALPTLVMFLVLRRHLTRGLALGATNG